MRAVMVDASLYTAPYDAGLSQGLVAAGVQPTWMTRPVRDGDRTELPPERTEDFFYRRTDQLSWIPARLRSVVKGAAHVAGTARMLWKIRGARPDVVHLQWLVIPLIDVVAMAVVRRWCPVVLTVHDTRPYNGQRMPWPQWLGSGLAARLAHRVVVHTRSGRQALRGAGVPDERIAVIPHGPLRLAVTAAPPAARDPRWTLVLFGEIKPYKGLDILIEAVAALPPALRDELRVVVAGRPRMDVSSLIARIAALDLGRHFDLRLARLSEHEMASLFAEADGFVFPYRHIDASGVYYLVKPLGKWLVASRVGAFAEDLREGEDGTLVPAEDVPALARALEAAIRSRPRGSACGFDKSWDDIGRATRTLYEQAAVEFAKQRPPRQRSAWQR